MFNFVPQFFQVVFKKTRDLTISVYTLKPQWQWKRFNISFHNMIFPKIQFPFKFKILLIEVSRYFLRGLAETCSTGSCDEKCLLRLVSLTILVFKSTLLESNPAIHLSVQTPC
jgi:hypothetical protein